VTVGGVAPTARPGKIRVLAVHRGNGKLDAAMSLHTTADVDGRFELAGLTPGHYEVQAALDDIWLSPPVPLDVAPNAAQLPPLALAIPAPGGAVRVTFPPNPAADLEVKVDHPGPLGEALWPQAFPADGAGVVFIPTLEKGRHTLRLPGGALREVDVPAVGQVIDVKL
jgi:hypothetical protein